MRRVVFLAAAPLAGAPQTPKEAVPIRLDASADEPRTLDEQHQVDDELP